MGCIGAGAVHSCLRSGLGYCCVAMGERRLMSGNNDSEFFLHTRRFRPFEAGETQEWYKLLNARQAFTEGAISGDE